MGETGETGRPGGTIDYDFEQSYRQGAPPWEIGAPQPAVARLVEAGLVVGSVLDLGCGTGENAFLLASRGHQVMGLDAAPTAVELARQKAASRGLGPPQVQFHVWDALQLGRLRKSFDTVLDSGLFHVFDRPTRRAYMESVAEVTASGADLLLLCFSDEEPPGPGPHRLTESEIRDAARSIFAVMDLGPERYERRAGPPARAWLARLTRI
jgi:SAM-dependent methyltransferase